MVLRPTVRRMMSRVRGTKRPGRVLSVMSGTFVRVELPLLDVARVVWDCEEDVMVRDESQVMGGCLRVQLQRYWLSQCTHPTIEARLTAR